MNDITKKTLELISTLNSEEECSIEISKDNRYIVKIKKDDKLKYIGSKYSVERDIEKFISEINTIENNENIIIFGLGAGEHIKYLLNNLSSTNKILIVEPSSEIIKETLKSDQIKDILEDDRISLCFLNNKIKNYINDFLDNSSTKNTKIVSFATYSSIFQDGYDYLLKQFKQIENSEKMTIDTFSEFSNEFFNNFMENIFTLANEGFYSVNQLKNLYKGKPAVIVSAGPSLTKNVHLLKEVQDKFIIICGPRTIGTLSKNDIRPDFVCSVDPQKNIYTLMKDYMDLKIPLVFMDSSNSKIVEEQDGPRIIAANQGMEKVLEDMMGINVDSLMQGGSVAHFEMGLAAYLGCSTIIFIGQDLAYTNDKFQADGTYVDEIDKIKYEYEKDKEKWDQDEKFNFYVKDIYGHAVRTSAVLKSYINEFEDLISGCDIIKFVNSTEGGAHIDGTEVMALKDTIDLYGIEIINKNLQNIIKEPVMANEEKFNKRMTKIIDKLEGIKKACNEGIKYSEQMLYFYKYNKKCNLNKVFSELDKIDEIINNREGLDFLAYSLLSNVDRVINSDYFKPQNDETEKKLGMRLAERGLFIYLSVSQTVEDAVIKIRNEFICKNDGNQVKKILEDGNFSFLNKPVERVTIDETKMLIGKAVNNNESTIMYSNKVDTRKYGLYNCSLALIKEKPINVNKEKYLCIKFKKVESVIIYLEFLDKDYVSFYKDVSSGIKQLDELENFKFQNFNVCFNVDTCQYIFTRGEDILYRSKVTYFEGEEIEIIVNFKNGTICLNDNIINVNKYFIDKYINNKYLIISSYGYNNEEIHYEAQVLVFGN